MGWPSILVADQDGLLRWSMGQSLGRNGYAVCSADTRVSVLEIAVRGGADVVVADYGFCQSDGLEFLIEIKSVSPKTHVIIITADATAVLARQVRNRGAFDVLEKPFPLSALKQAVGRALATPERRKGPRCCSDGCDWTRPCKAWHAVA